MHVLTSNLLDLQLETRIISRFIDQMHMVASDNESDHHPWEEVTCGRRQFM